MFFIFIYPIHKGGHNRPAAVNVTSQARKKTRKLLVYRVVCLPMTSSLLGPVSVDKPLRCSVIVQCFWLVGFSRILFTRKAEHHSNYFLSGPEGKILEGWTHTHPHTHICICMYVYVCIHKYLHTYRFVCKNTVYIAYFYASVNIGIYVFFSNFYFTLKDRITL